MSTPDEALAAALHTSLFGELCLAEVTFDRECEADDHIEDAKAVSAALTAEGFAIVRSDELAGLRAAARKALVLVAAERIKTPGGAIDVWHANGKHWDEPLQVKRCPWCQAEADLRSALEGVSR